MSEQPTTGDWPAPVGAELGVWPALPGYEILAELGRGGMGVVYKAWQESLKRLVALKMIRAGAPASPEERYRFHIEAAAAARLRHPNVVSIYEVGEHAGEPYFAMELLEGGSLHTRLAGRPQPATQAAGLVRTLALAVQHAHEQKIVHRDLKPANVLLAPNPKSEIRNPKQIQIPKKENPKPQGAAVSDLGDSDLGIVSDFEFRISDFEPKVADFGLAKRLDADSTAWTQPGAVLGTASYMAPEQAAGRVRELGPAVDIYALGAILYEMLTGRPPFRAESWHETIQQVLHGEPAPPSRLQPDVPRDLDTVCLKCLEKDPVRRYTRADELADDLGWFLNGTPVCAVPLTALERLARLAARDGYHLIGEIGLGPRSTVYHARYEPLNQPVALKVFPVGTCTRAEWEARLRRGADLWAGLSHPHLMPVHRAGWWDGAPWLPIDYVPQGSLAGKVAGRASPVHQGLRLVEQLAEIVAYLHRQGVIHGNLKPTNILLAADGIPRIADLRLFAGLSQGPLPRDRQEPAGLGYLAPELVRDAGAEPRPFTDTYGLGLILYELLTGRPAFAAETAREMLDQVRDQDPVPPSCLNPEVTPPVERLCLMCLQKNPWRRFVRAYDLATALRHCLDALKGSGVPRQQLPPRRKEVR